MAVQTLATLTVENKQFYERALFERLQPNLVFAKYGTKKSYGEENNSKVISDLKEQWLKVDEQKGPGL